MFEKGDLVTYGCKGVCEVKNITTLNLEGIPKDRLYYEMQSMVNAGSRIFSPVGQEEKNAMRAVLTKEEAEELLGQLPECRLCWEKDERRRASVELKNYKESLIKRENPEQYIIDDLVGFRQNLCRRLH